MKEERQSEVNYEEQDKNYETYSVGKIRCWQIRKFKDLRKINRRKYLGLQRLLK